MALAALVFPVKEDKKEKLQAFINELKTTRHDDFVKSREAIGVHERTFLQSTPMGDMVIVTIEGDDPKASFAKFVETHDEFTDWFIEQVNEIHGMDMRQAIQNPMPELITDSGE